MSRSSVLRVAFLQPGHRMTEPPLVSAASACASVIFVPLCEGCRCFVKKAEDGKRQIPNALDNTSRILSLWNLREHVCSCRTGKLVFCMRVCVCVCVSVASLNVFFKALVGIKRDECLYFREQRRVRANVPVRRDRGRYRERKRASEGTAAASLHCPFA